MTRLLLAVLHGTASCLSHLAEEVGSAGQHWALGLGFDSWKSPPSQSGVERARLPRSAGSPRGVRHRP